jgi:NAD(P)-dependent dehydrogenase (short-subunit alcohol dehydrogenase family)
MRGVAVVTGANRGLGFGVVEGLLEREFDTVLGSRDLERGESAAQALPDRDRAFVRRLDVTDQATIDGGPGGRPVRDGAASVLWAVDLPDDGPTGGFLRDGAAVAW